MQESIQKRICEFRGIVLASFVGLFALGLFACAATTVSQRPAFITDVRVEEDADATRVILVGLDHPVFTAFQQKNPERVVIDLASVEVQGFTGPIAVDNDLIEEISVSPFSTGSGGSLTRVEISLREVANYRVNSTEEGLEIVVASGGVADEQDLIDEWAGAEEYGNDADESAVADPWAIEPIGVASADEPAREAVVSTSWEARPATTLLAIEASSTPDQQGSLIRLIANGTVSSATTFTLLDPDRLVVDLPNMRSEVGTKPIVVNSVHAARVRVGQHDGMVRVVIDAPSGRSSFDGRRIVPAPDGLLITLGTGDLLDLAVTQIGRAVAPMAKTATESGAPGKAGMNLADAIAALEAEERGQAVASPEEDEATPSDFDETWALAGNEEPPLPASPAVPSVESNVDKNVLIYAVEFSAREQADRILVFGERPFDYLIYEPDPETLVLSIEGAKIDPDAEVRIAPAEPGPVSLVTSFVQPDVAPSEVRIVMKRAPGAKPTIRRKGNLLQLDFPRDGGIAKRPPLLAALDAANALDAEAPITAADPPFPAAMAPGDELAVGDTASVSAGLGADAVPAALEPPAAIAILNEGGLQDGKEYVGRRISLDFKDVEIADVLRLIAEVSDLNVVAGDEVNGTVTIRLVDVPWDQALDVILLTKALGFVRVGNVLRIAPADLLRQEDELRLQERRNIEALEDLIVKLQPVNYADVAEIARMVTKLLTPRGTVNTDKRTNTLIIKDIPTVVDEATALIKAIDTQTPQVMIEAKIVEASLDFDRQFGSTGSRS